MDRFEWDEEKAKRNLLKHGLDFEAVRRFEFDAAINWLADRNTYGEERIIAVSALGDNIYTLIYTIRGEAIRVISLRRASQKEMSIYARSRE
ncbi:BrnT family toxin [Phyllobacterium endophyticum]|uniref:BrnT family toxin n=1 Tax=Phyllobacterium endophyticum TaxID=1149773 RepID=UPI0011C8903A|nr:BrnT family toxin [Phyllobacterium endophyticum]TXR49224.1 BrnT family toxin [Phyllobacterium endophyticum]